MLVRAGIQRVTVRSSVDGAERETRLMDRVGTPFERWTLGPMNLESRKLWVDDSTAKDTMVEHTDRDETPWVFVNADNNRFVAEVH